MDAAIEKAFKELGNFIFKEREALQQCRQLAEEHNLKAIDVAKHYDAFAAVRDASFDVSLSNVLAFAKFLVQELAVSTKAKQASMAKPRVISKTREMPMDYPTPKRPAKENLISMTTPGSRGTPVHQHANRSPMQATPGSATTFSERGNKGQILSSYNGAMEVPASSGAARDKAMPSLQLLGEPLVAPGVMHLHMMDTVEGKVHAINERILDFGSALRRVLPDEARDINSTSVAEVTQEPVWVVGRVVAESATGALNDQSVLLEGSREASGGARVKLDLSTLPSFRLFPGQVVCAKGLNPTGSTFIAQQLVTHLPPAAKQQCNGSSEADKGPCRALSMVIAAGPFTTSDNMHFEPLGELLRHCSDTDVDQVVLLGPFVDVEHPCIRDGSLGVSFEQVFREQVLSMLTAWQQEQGNQRRRVVLLPSVRDVHALPVFPQPPLSIDGGCGERLRSLQSPCSFSSEGLTVAASSQDVLMHLSACEVSRGQGMDRMTALASHVVGQQSFYPLFPPPLGACLDTSHYSHLQLCSTPDLLVLPSSLAPFAKLLPLGSGQLPGGPAMQLPGAPEATVVVNPGRLAKGVSGGTFAHVYFAASTNAAQSGQPAERHQQMRVDIRRL